MKIGQARADDVILTGRSLTADEAANFGIVNRCYDDQAAMYSGEEEWIAKYILPRSASSLRFAVWAARWQFNQVLNEQLDRLQQFYVNDLMASHDANEGIQAFLGKRPPVWTNG